jgi:hypothetical protein
VSSIPAIAVLAAMERYDDYYRSTPEVFGSDPNSILVEYAGLETIHSWEGLGPKHRHGDGPPERHGLAEAVLRRS